MLLPILRQLSRRTRTVLSVVGAVAIVVAIAVLCSDQLDFIIGGALIDLGYRAQDPIDLPEHRTPDRLWSELIEHNALAASVRETFPRSTHHPAIALVVCMDARIDTNELVGDTRRYYYVLRLAGSVMSEREEEMLELAVDNGVSLVVLTTHTECAAEHVASDPELRARYPHLAEGVDERDARRAEFLARPGIAEHIRDGTLRVEEARIDTATGRLEPTPSRAAHAALGLPRAGDHDARSGRSR
jgi:carbonic anhydrase